VIRATATIDTDRILGRIDPMIYGQYLEHEQPEHHCIYGAIQDEGPPQSGKDGFRLDVIDLVRELDVPVVRWPGGCFADIYHWEDVPGGYQALCYNEIPTKINWHYLRWVFDTRTRRNTELQVNDLVMDLRNLPVPIYDEAYYGCERLLNFCIDVRTYTPVRNFLWLDSVVVSTDW
jgi:hypothetical protein